MYLKKHPYELFLSYLYIGVLMFFVNIINLIQLLKQCIRLLKMDIHKQNYSNQIDKTKSYLFNIGLISEDNQIIESFKQFSKSYNNLNLSFFNREKNMNLVLKFLLMMVLLFKIIYQIIILKITTFQIIILQIIILKIIILHKL